MKREKGTSLSLCHHAFQMSEAKDKWPDDCKLANFIIFIYLLIPSFTHSFLPLQDFKIKTILGGKKLTKETLAREEETINFYFMKEKDT